MAAPSLLQSCRTGAVAAACLLFALPPGHQPQAQEFIYFACGNDLPSMHRCLASARRWEKKGDYPDHRVIVVPGPFSSLGTLNMYECEIQKIMRESDLQNIGVDDFGIDVALVDIVHLPSLANRNAVSCSLTSGCGEDKSNPHQLSLLDFSSLKDKDFGSDSLNRAELTIAALDDLLNEQEKTIRDVGPVSSGGDAIFGIPYFANVPLLYININHEKMPAQPIPTDQGWEAFFEAVVAAQSASRAAQPASRKEVLYSFQTARDESTVAMFFDFFFEGFEDHYRGVTSRDGFVDLAVKILDSADLSRKMTKLLQIAQHNREADHAAVDEQASLDSFIAEKAAMMRNWPFALARIDEEPNSPEFATKPLPSGTLGVWYIGVNENRPRSPADLAAVLDFVLHSSSRDEQSERFKLGYFPTLSEVYEEGADQYGDGVPEAVRRSLSVAVERPSHIYRADYPDVARALAQALHDFFSSPAETPPERTEAFRRFKEAAKGIFRKTRKREGLAVESDPMSPNCG